MIGIIGAMEEEVAILKGELQSLEEINIAHVKFYKGTLKGKSVVLTQSGIGKVNVAISSALLINEFNPSIIINTGSAGALDDKLNIGDVVVSETVGYHDADARAFGYVLGQLPDMPAVYNADQHLLAKAIDAIEAQQLVAHTGLIVSGDSFIGTNDQRLTIKRHFNQALAVEMEAGAIAQTCYQFDVPFIITRAISDKSNGEANVTFDEFLGEAAKSSSDMVRYLIESLDE
ncbi:5'-methylthioadenosine/adenosylhomocysteine nucleosidase [Staphylococcus auricularis]|uniref:5'-methylthioadenosine/S-adenosylhomocysteine nucleosidase n=1 Tax=Staphylococcus auricularis TaxID=29379 RepID=A0ABX5IHL2_9STAP|nr:5'-methylthioadenosine/adenosylhomocysteine nucleosidase [Staphylococcus auricularis]MCE5038210.1 5'-methylthioadenosine/adenosylhomocysteine nucleosidase [Staphylococcus auricularis]MEB6569271.1 5'-methylthioadenosine/adenosylhomocysteine nucleosidase [Staphylococcus auricularis]PTH18426.1 5'-methylthioadenosine/S-adenosylhomocysteine nucleosidase [Staphylococcus auricularis]PTH25658.1 5'-methylthioadenosine/S-adenosylhomocysteine nucleosidase [Staphylococcus auricularis]